jgi:hypothetical protein
MEGNLDIGLCEFKGMKSIDRDILIYNNLVHIRKKIEDYKFHKKLQYIWLSVLTILLGLKKFMGI